MPTLKRIHVATPGNKRARNGTSLALTDYDLAELAESYSPHLHQCKVAVDDVQTAIQLGAPAVLGHLDPRLVQAKGAMPAFGRVLAAEADSRGLWLDLELTEPMANYMQQGMYDHVSLSWYDRKDSRNPTPGRLHVRHLGLLGCEGSSMKDLALPDVDFIEFSEGELDSDNNVYQVVQLTTPLEFAEARMDSVTIEDQAAVVDDETADPVQMLIEVLSSGGKGYKGEITGFVPEATADNSYLWDADKQQFAGQFLDNSGNEEETYNFTVVLQDDGSMIRSYKRVMLDEAEPMADDAAVEAEATVADDAAVADDPATEMSEGFGTDIGEMSVMSEAVPMLNTISVDAAEYSELKAKATLYGAMLAEQAERARRDAVEELQTALRPLYDMGLINPDVPSADIAKALMSMSEEAGSCCDENSYSLEFSEGEVHTSPRQTVLAVFAQIGHNASVQKDTEIEFGEMDMPKSDDKAKGADLPSGVVANPKQADLDRKARQYCKDNDMNPKDSKSYIKAIKAVS